MWVSRSAILLAALWVTPLLASPDILLERSQADTCESVSTVTVEPSVSIQTVTVTVEATVSTTSPSGSVAKSPKDTASTSSTSSKPGASRTSKPGHSSGKTTGGAASETPSGAPSGHSSETPHGTPSKSSSGSASDTSSAGTSPSDSPSETPSKPASSSPPNASSHTPSQTQPSDVVIGSLTVQIQSTPTTISQSGEPPIVVGPSGIQVGSESANSPTTMTADGVTVTYDGPRESGSGDSSSTPSGDETTTSSGAAASGTSSSSMASPWKGYVTIDGETYHIPSDDSSTDIVLDDGSVLTLSKGEISVDGDTVSIPDDVSDNPKLNAGGKTLTAGEGFDAAGGSGGGGSGGGMSSLIDTISGLGDSESSLSSGLDKITSGIKSWGSGGAQSEVTSLSGSVDSAVESLDKLLAPMRSISQSSGIELQELTQDGLRVVSKAYPELERGRDILSSMQKLLKGLPTLRDAATSNVKKYWLQYVAAGGGILALEESIKKLKDYSWDDALVATSTSTSAEKTTSATATSTTSTDSPSPSSQYMITTEKGTSLTKFKAFIQGLDGGVGDQIVYSELDHQTYVTDLTVKQVAVVKALPFINECFYVVPATELDDDDDMRAVPNRAFLPEIDEYYKSANKISPLSRKQLHSRATYSTRSNSGSYLKLISSNAGGKPTDDYKFKDSLGKDTTIYIIDTGFNLSKPDLAANGRKVDSYVVRNEFTLPGIAKNVQKPPDLSDWGRHGTGVAAVAGGVIRGVASNANLYLVKFKNGYDDPNAKDGTGVTKPGISITALRDAFDNVISHIRKNNNQGKAVVNLSSGSKFGGTQHDKDREEVYKRFFKDLKAEDVVNVIAAGNMNTEQLSDRVPQKMGTRDNGIITVGGVDESGQLWEHSTYQGPGGGFLTVFAQAKNVELDVPDRGVTMIDGTSFAAPAVAGLAAYYLGDPDTKKMFTTGDITRKMKSYIRKVSFQRVNQVSSPNAPANYVLPSYLNVAYNLGRGNPPGCGRKLVPRADSDDICTVSSSSAGMSSPSGPKSTTVNHSKTTTTNSPTTTSAPVSCYNYQNPGVVSSGCQCEGFDGVFAEMPSTSGQTSYDACGWTTKPPLAESTASTATITEDDGTMEYCTDAVKANPDVNDSMSCKVSGSSIGINTSAASQYSASVASASASASESAATASASASASAQISGLIAIAGRFGDESSWAVQRGSSISEPVYWCETKPNLFDENNDLTLSDTLQYPGSFKFSDFSTVGNTTDNFDKWPCSYEGSDDKPGTLKCDGWKTITCDDDKGDTSDDDGNEVQYGTGSIRCGDWHNQQNLYYEPRVMCVFKDSDKE